jgi:hypothetical protein
MLNNNDFRFFAIARGGFSSLPLRFAMTSFTVYEECPILNVLSYPPFITDSKKQIIS